MPELPEVETTRRGIAPFLVGQEIRTLLVRERRLRWPIPAGLEARVAGQRILSVSRRGKYLILGLQQGSLILHLGMSGSLRVTSADTPPARHDHLDLILQDGSCLRMRDPRRFGSLLWTDQPPLTHPLLAHLGPEPLSDGFDGAYLHRLAGQRRVAIKTLIMDAKVVVGVGNIYANESLFLAGIHPRRACHRISRKRLEQLARTIKRLLGAAIAQGGTTLRDFQREDGSPGYFALSLQVYGKSGEPCPRCGRPIRQRRIGQRSSYYCGHCQR